MDDAAVEEAILSMNGTELGGRVITVYRESPTGNRSFRRKAGIATLVAQAAAEGERGGVLRYEIRRYEIRRYKDHPASPRKPQSH